MKHSLSIAPLPHCLIAPLLAPLLVLSIAGGAEAQTITYHVTIPEPAQHWLQVEAIFPDLGRAPLRAYMSRSSPGRYAVHEFAKNVFWVEASDSQGRALRYTRPNPYEWDVGGHDGSVRLVYRVFGDRVDGTYLGIDVRHAHMNMPATFMFDLDRQDWPLRVSFTPPEGFAWRVATQLYPTTDPFTFTAPNLQYFMDSPTEFSDFLTSRFTLRDGAGHQRTFRLVAHTDASPADLTQLTPLVERLVRQEEAVFGEFPEYEPGEYTFLLDYWPTNDGDGMEHRNSTVITQGLDAPLRNADGRRAALDTMAHEFFHNWNVERIRPEGLEPFDFTRVNITCCLWLAEGFTQYYGPLLLTRAGLGGGGLPANPIPVINGSGREVRSAVQMSEYAAFADAARSVDPTDQSRSFISYYTYGAALALALDLSLRDMTNGAITLDAFMRRLWEQFGKPGGPQPGLVARPYSVADLRATLADLTGNRGFADQYFDRYVEGREVPDYARLLARAGFALRPANPAAAWTGVQVRSGPDGLVVTSGARGGGSLVPFGTPAYLAGLEREDVITAIGGERATLDAWNVLNRKRPGERVQLVVVHRGGRPQTTTLTLAIDPTLQIVDLGSAMTSEQRRFRDAWLGVP